MICAIDPGLRHCGVSLFSVGGGLLWADLVKSPNEKDFGPAAWKAMAAEVAKSVTRPVMPHTLIIEVPRVYSAAKQKGDQNDLIQLAGVVGAISAHFGVGLYYYPHEWKGQMDKTAMNLRVLEAIQPGEMKNLLSQNHNVLDAVGIGLHWFRRINQKKVFR